MSQALAAQQQAAEREAKETPLDSQRNMMISMHMEQRGALVHIICLERQDSGEQQYNDDTTEETRPRHSYAESQEERRGHGVSQRGNRYNAHVHAQEEPNRKSDPMVRWTLPLECYTIAKMPRQRLTNA